MARVPVAESAHEESEGLSAVVGRRPALMGA
jgi:hypothetical protein